MFKKLVRTLIDSENRKIEISTCIKHCQYLQEHSKVKIVKNDL